MAKSRSRKQRLHTAYAQRKRDKRRRVLAQRGKGRKTQKRVDNVVSIASWLAGRRAA